jgi:membrane-associated protein
MIQSIVKALLAIPPPYAIAVVFLLAAGETALFLGFVIPGELVVILGGALAARAHVPLAGILAAGILGPIAGDSIGYFVGRRYGYRFLKSHGKKRWARGRLFLRRHGASAVFVGRFTAFLRSIVPAAAGAARIEYANFLRWSVAAGLLWGAASALLGYFAGRNYEALARWVGHFGLALLALVGVSAAATLLYRRARRRSRPSRRRK